MKDLKPDHVIAAIMCVVGGIAGALFIWMTVSTLAR